MATTTPTFENYRQVDTTINFILINLQHSRAATHNLTQVIEEGAADIIFVQEPYTVQNRPAGIPHKYKIFNSGTGKNSGPGGSSGKALGCELDGPGSIPGVRGVEIFLYTFVSRLVLGSTRPPIK